MKQTLFLLIAILLSSGAFGQKKSTPEAKAEKHTKEMQEVLGFDDNTYKKVYAIHLEHVKKIGELKESSGEDKEAFKSAKKDSMKSTKQNLTEVLGKENMEKWQAHKKANKKKAPTDS